MATPQWIEGAALEEYLPHRGVNLLIDAFRTRGDADHADGECRVRIAPGDARGRDIFLRESQASGHAIIEPALAEYLALGAICVLKPDMAPGELAFFSVISECVCEREARAGELLTGIVTRLRDKARFRRFEGTVQGEDGATVATAEIMAYTADPSSSGKRETARLLNPPSVRAIRPVDRARFPWKRPQMVFVDERIDIAADFSQATFRYTYPSDHPFCPGHFPDNPVMMGISQWIAALDAATWLVAERAEAGHPAAPADTWHADVEILRQSGMPVAEIRELTFRARPSAGSIPPVGIISTRRVGFRDQVRPGETVFIRARIAPGGERADA